MHSAKQSETRTRAQRKAKNDTKRLKQGFVVIINIMIRHGWCWCGRWLSPVLNVKPPQREREKRNPHLRGMKKKRNTQGKNASKTKPNPELSSRPQIQASPVSKVFVKCLGGNRRESG